MVVCGRPESAQKIIKFGFGPVSSFLLILNLRSVADLGGDAFFF